MTRWDVAKFTLRCKQCREVIGAGEQYRKYSAADLPLCCVCAFRVTQEPPPPDMPATPLVPELKPPATWHESNEPPLMSTRERQRVAAARRRQTGGW